MIVGRPAACFSKPVDSIVSVIQQHVSCAVQGQSAACQRCMLLADVNVASPCSAAASNDALGRCRYTGYAAVLVLTVYEIYTVKGSGWSTLPCDNPIMQ